jgi:ubiquinone/menaquinone biosynthesis C-methylase UbiE
VTPWRQSPVGEELLDRPDAPADLVQTTLYHLARSNRWFGGAAAAKAGVRRLLTTGTRRITLLDIGTGAGDLPLAIADDLSRRAIEVTALGVDRLASAAAMASRAGVPSVSATAACLPVRAKAVDIVLMSQLAHHFDGAGVVALIREASRVARLGVVIADLRRSAWARWLFPLGGRVLRFDRVTIADGVTSLRRGFTRRELAGLIRTAGFEPIVSLHLGARIVASWRTD